MCQYRDGFITRLVEEFVKYRICAKLWRAQRLKKQGDFNERE